MLHLVSFCLCCYTVPDPDLEIRDGGGHPDPKIRGGGRPVSKKIFSALRASVWSKNKGWARAPRNSPLDPPLLHVY